MPVRVGKSEGGRRCVCTQTQWSAYMCVFTVVQQRGQQSGQGEGTRRGGMMSTIAHVGGGLLDSCCVLGMRSDVQMVRRERRQTRMTSCHNPFDVGQQCLDALDETVDQGPIVAFLGLLQNRNVC